MKPWQSALHVTSPAGESRSRITELLGDDLGWVNDSAVCASSDPEIPFPEKGGTANPAKQMCKVCPLVEACLEYSLNHTVHGVWGGVGDKGRRALLKSRAA